MARLSGLRAVSSSMAVGKMRAEMRRAATALGRWAAREGATRASHASIARGSADDPAMGGEGGIINQPGQQTVFGQMESYDPKTNRWQSHAPMPTPRHAVGAVAIGDWIYVAGGGAVLGGAVQSAIHEAFTLSLP